VPASLRAGGFFKTNMDPKLKQEKLKMWKKQEQDLQKELAETLKRKGAAAQEGDLKENAGYVMAIEQSEVISARLASIKRVIQELETGVVNGNN
jgi:transcription elongation GreA/GreB family factor